MPPRLSFVSLLCFCLLPDILGAQIIPDPPARVENQTGRFTYYTLRDEDSYGALKIRYTVCNNHPDRSLWFKWREPGIAASESCPVAPGTCGDLEIPDPHRSTVDSENQPISTTLDYWHVSNDAVYPTVPVPILSTSSQSGGQVFSGGLRTKLFLIFGRPGSCPNMRPATSAEVFVRNSEDGGTELFIDYQRRDVDLAIGLPPIETLDTDFDQLVQALNSVGIQSAVVELAQLVGSDEAQDIQDETSVGRAVVLPRNPEGVGPVSIALKTTDSSLVKTPIILSRDGTMVARFNAWIWLPIRNQE